VALHDWRDRWQINRIVLADHLGGQIAGSAAQKPVQVSGR
jgi:hypothetical protein